MNAAGTEESAQDQRPTPLPVVAKNIPDQLKTLAQWVTWKYELRDNKWTKPPYEVNGRDYAKSSDTSTWGKFEDALKTYKNGRVDGIGIMLAVDTGIVGVDLDHYRDPQKGSFGAWGKSISKVAIEIIEHFDSYTEVSPSGTGVRIFVKGKLPAGGRKKGNIEIYSTGRYLTVTGHAVRNRISRVIELRQAEIDASLLEHFPDPKSKPNHSTNGNGAWHPSDEELLKKAFAAKNGDKLKALFRGDVGSYPSQSEADLALCSLLAFWAQGTAQLDRFYRRSSLYRDKWDQKHGAMTYGEMTIEKAFASCAEHYSRNGNGHAENEGETHQPLIITMDQIKAEKVDWLWDNRIPIGRLTLLDGDPGSGKVSCHWR